MKKNRKWSIEEKISIVKRVLESSESISAIARQYDMSTGMISNWIREYELHGEKAFEPKGKPFNGFHMKKNPTEIETLRYKVFKLEMENELLKKGLDPERVWAIAEKKKGKSSK